MHAFDENLLQVNWEKKSSLMSADDIFAFESLARAFIVANQTLPKNAQLLIKEYSLDHEAGTYLEDHLKHLHALQKYIAAVCHPDDIPLTALSGETIKKVAKAKEEQSDFKNRFFSSQHHNNALRDSLLLEINGIAESLTTRNYHINPSTCELNVITTIENSSYEQDHLAMG